MNRHYKQGNSYKRKLEAFLQFMGLFPYHPGRDYGGMHGSGTVAELHPDLQAKRENWAKHVFFLKPTIVIFKKLKETSCHTTELT